MASLIRNALRVLSVASRQPVSMLAARTANPSVRFASSSSAATSPSAKTRKTTTTQSESLSSAELIALDEAYGAHNYHPIPIVFSRASGSRVWDPEGAYYFDFLSAYSAVNQGHQHPRIIGSLVEQAHHLTLSSRAFYNDKFPLFAEKITRTFGYDRVLPMNTGAEGVETALKIAKKWAYDVKGVPYGQALVLSCCGCFHGRTTGCISLSCDPDVTHGFAPHQPGHLKVNFDDLAGLEAQLKAHGPKLAAFILEPIQGEAGVVIPSDGYLAKVRELCTKHNVLMIADEIQTGLGRTGKLLACDYEGVHPDLLILGKALGGGVYPISVVLADNAVMDVITPGSHGSTFGGNPLASAVGIAALDVLIEEGLIERAFTLGEQFRSEMRRINSPAVLSIRGRGLLNAIVIKKIDNKTAWELCLLLKEHGVLAKPTHGDIIRIAPPLSITDEDFKTAMELFEKGLKEYETVPIEQIPGAIAKSASEKPAAVLCERCGKDLS
eukprot:c12625_g1_i1.p1 GENE.c12625_g1_i1~~c12625_g1_i1.p1  ORF type:complete len:496 (-),score=116.51 c12625_g1_i1:68-1555(-)